MAALAQYHLPLLFLIAFLFSAINGNFMQPLDSTCPAPVACGNGITIRYPFWHQNLQLDHHCGYPGFNVSCNDKEEAMISLSEHLYHVKSIDYSSKSIILGYVELAGFTNCPKISHGGTPNTTSSLFDSVSGNKSLRFFYNCTLYPPSLPQIECLAYGSKRSYVFQEGAVPEFDWHRFCESTASVAVNGVAAVNRDLVHGFGQALKDGFTLTWQQPEGSVCQTCEATGGFCRYSNDQPTRFLCICADGRQSNHCHNTGSVSVQHEPTYLAIGALLIGGLSIVAAAIYFLTRRTMAISYKPV